MINNYYDEIKNELINNEVYKKVKDYSKNRNELSIYYNVGKLLIEAQGGEDRAKYGDGLIKEYSERLTRELGKGYSTRSLKKYEKVLFIVRKRAYNVGLIELVILLWVVIVEIYEWNNLLYWYFNKTKSFL